MFIPIIPNVTVENKTIVYSDTILPLKETGKNLKVTSIEDVVETSLEDCIKTIFQSNPDVVFNTIQYSKKDKTVYFYTNKEINTKKFEESKYIKYKPISSRFQILEEVKHLLTSNKIKNNDCISLYDIGILMSQTEHKYKSIIDCYKEQLKTIIKSKFYNSSSILIYDFNYENNELSIGFCSYGYNFDKITFIKEEGDLYISKSESCHDKEILVTIGTELSQLYDEFIKFSAYKNENNFFVKPVNSSFLVNISSYGVNIFVKSPTNKFMNDFKLTFPDYYNDEYKYDCNSASIINAFEGNENEIFKRIFVKIEDCPKWSQKILYEIRQNQLEEEQKIEDKIKHKERIKQKRLELTRKIFPFLKK